jgi:hypothetical protein
VDEEGLRADDLSERSAGLLYLAPSHQYPTGHLFSASRREQLIAAHIGFRGDGAGLSGSSDIPKYSALLGSQRLARELRFAGRRLI